MSDHPSNSKDETNPKADPPASVVFMEMMRRAAAGGQPADETDTAIPDQVEAQTQQRPMRNPEEIARAEAERRKHEAALEAARIRRVQRRRQRRRTQTVSGMGGCLRTLLLVIVSGGLIATILSWWTSPDSLDPEVRAEIGQLILPSATPEITPTTLPTPNWLRRIGIISGHRGPQNDPGAVCEDTGLTENEINLAVAQLVVIALRDRGYTVDLLEELDDKLDGYQGSALLSIHANTCQDYGVERVSGFLIAYAEARPPGGEDERLVNCVAAHYESVTGLEKRPFGLTRDMVDYHAFRKIDFTTPGAIIETGFMLADQDILVNHADRVAQGIVEGLLCFLESDPGTPIDVPTAVPLDTETPDPAAGS